MRDVDPKQDMAPLPPPIRAAAPTRFPVPGRPHWFTDGKGGAPYYVEPVKPAQVGPP